MSRFYHEFVPGFNTWYVVAPLLLVVAIVAGAYELKKVAKNGPVWKHFSNDFLNGLLMGLSVGVASWVGYLVWRESATGILQLFHNCLTAGESTFYSTGLACLALGLIPILFGVLFYFAFWLGAIIKVTYLKSIKRSKREQRCR